MILACHDCSEGGLAVAMAEMAFAGGLGASYDVTALQKQSGIAELEALLFSESPSRFIVEVSKENEAKFLETVKDLPVCKIGETRMEKILTVSTAGKIVVEESIETLKTAWKTGVKI